MKWLVFLFLIPLAEASIFGSDDRLNLYEVQDELIREQAPSVVSLVRQSKLKLSGDHYKVEAKTLTQAMNFCEDSRFSKELMIANCSGALVAPDLILTAAHCVDDKKPEEEYYVVFDYIKNSPYQRFDRFSKDQVFKIKEISYADFEFGYGTTWNDIALVRIDKKVDRKILKVDYDSSYRVGTPLYLIGYPLGISQKVVGGESLLSLNITPNSFRHELDSFSVNSGSPIFDELTGMIIGVHVRGTGLNAVETQANCRDWHIGVSGKDYSEGNTLHLSAPTLRNIIQASN